jgi:hypothetical protein
MQLCVRGVSAGCARFRSVLLTYVSDHGPRRTVLLDRDEAGRLVEATRRIGLPGAETDCCVSLSDAGVDEAGEEPAPDSRVSTRSDDGDRQLRHVLAGKAVAMVRLRVRGDSPLGGPKPQHAAGLKRPRWDIGSCDRQISRPAAAWRSRAG